MLSQNKGQSFIQIKSGTNIVNCTVSYLLAAEGTDRVDGEAGLNGVEPNRSSLNGSAFCGTVPLCECERLDESLGTFGGGATVTNCSCHVRVNTHTHTHTHTQMHANSYKRNCA
jgi:hypothetical protein